MTTRNMTIVESDLSGEGNASTISFGIKGAWYEIDLTADEQAKLEEALVSYIEAGRKATPKATVRKDVIETTAEQRELVREWAKGKGIEVAERGRIPKKVTAQYIREVGPLESPR